MKLIYEEVDKERILEISLSEREIKSLFDYNLLHKRIKIKSDIVTVCVRINTQSERYERDDEQEVL